MDLHVKVRADDSDAPEPLLQSATAASLGVALAQKLTGRTLDNPVTTAAEAHLRARRFSAGAAIAASTWGGFGFCERDRDTWAWAVPPHDAVGFVLARIDPPRRKLWEVPATLAAGAAATASGRAAALAHAVSGHASLWPAALREGVRLRANASDVPGVYPAMHAAEAAGAWGMSFVDAPGTLIWFGAPACTDAIAERVAEVLARHVTPVALFSGTIATR